MSREMTSLVLPWRFTPRGLEIDRDLTQDEWKACGRRIAAMGDGLTWAIGDWLLIGGRGEFGESYNVAQTITGHGKESLSQAYRVAKAYPFNTRVLGATWSMHRDALRLPEAKRVPALKHAVDQKVGTGGFRRRLAAARHRGEALPAPKDRTGWRPQPNKHAITCPHCKATFHRRSPDHSILGRLERLEYDLRQQPGSEALADRVKTIHEQARGELVTADQAVAS